LQQQQLPLMVLGTFVDWLAIVFLTSSVIVV
jgi:hypothetical protein